MAISPISPQFAQLQTHLKPNQAILLSRPADIRYFSGYNQFLVPEEREGFCLISRPSVGVLFPSLNHFTQLPGVDYFPGHSPQQLANFLVSEQKRVGWTELLIDETSLSLAEYRRMAQNLQAVRGVHIEVMDQQQIWRLRMIKTTNEIKAIHTAINITHQVHKYAKRVAKTGVTEKQLAEKIENKIRQLNGWPLAFPTIVAFGKSTALPHYQPGTTKLKSEMAVLIDCGATVHGYCADMTSSWWHGNNPPKTYQKITKLVHLAFSKAHQAAKVGQTAGQVDRAAREVITQAGFGKNFIHTTGHGLGLSIHEPPSLNSQNQQSLKKNMVITIEPGIYLQNTFGVRHEDVVIIN